MDFIASWNKKIAPKTTLPRMCPLHIPSRFVLHPFNNSHYWPSVIARVNAIENRILKCSMGDFLLQLKKNNSLKTLD